MATATHVKLSLAGKKPVFAAPNLTEGSTQKVSDLLNENLEKFHIFFNKSGFHNHIVHHLLTSYALGADPQTLQKNYEENVTYQMPAKTLTDKQAVIEDLRDPAIFIKNLGKDTDQCYTKFLAFFQSEIAAKGWEQVFNEYVLANDERANEMLARMFAGFLHPIIHVGFGIEFEQPAIIAEGLAEAAAYDGKLKSFFLMAEEGADATKRGEGGSESLMQLLHEIEADAVLTASTRWTEGDKIGKGILGRAEARMSDYASQYFIQDEAELEKRTAEMIHLCAYFASASQRHDKVPKFDFFNIHAVNCSIFFTIFLHLPQIATKNKIRLLEWKARVDLLLYAASHCAPLLPELIKDYKPSQKYTSDDKDDWSPLYHRSVSIEDDGHVPKLIRALAHAKEVCVPFENDRSLHFVIRGDMWNTIARMAIESVDSGGPLWIRGAGWDEAWKDVPARGSKFIAFVLNH